MMEFEEKLKVATQSVVECVRAQCRRLVDHVERERALGLGQVEEKRAALAREIQAMRKLQQTQDSKVELDVGGHKYSTSVATLRCKPGTMLDAMFSGRYNVNRSEDGSVFIDRDGQWFGEVLSYLRDGKVHAGSKETLRRLKKEFEFFAIDLREEREVAYAVGGCTETSGATSLVERYDADTLSWKPARSMSCARSHHSVCCLLERLYAIGGMDSLRRRLETVEMYTPSLDTWTTVSPLPEPRCAHGSCAVGGVVYVLGGANASNEVVDTVLEYSPQTDSWSKAGAMPGRRCFSGVCVEGCFIYVIGGIDEHEQPTDTVFMLNTKSMQWSTRTPLPRPRSALGVVELDGMIYAIGGRESAHVDAFNPSTDTWTTSVPMRPRSSPSCFVLAGFIHTVGGSDADNTVVGSVAKYDTEGKAWTVVSTLGAARTNLGTAVVNEERDLFDAMIERAARSECFGN